MAILAEMTGLSDGRGPLSTPIIRCVAFAYVHERTYTGVASHLHCISI
jgi:hypothetical protein